MSKKERPNPEVSKTSNIVNLGEYCAERAETARKRRALEYLIRLREEADRSDEPILNETERCLGE